MRTKSTAIHDTAMFEVQPGGQGRVKDPAPDKRLARNRKSPTGQDRAGRILQPIRRVLSPALWIWAGLLGSVLTYPACAQEAWNPFSRAPLDPIEQGKIDSANDPAEAINREIFKANKFLDDTILKPVARAYAENLSPDVRQGLHDFANNVGEPAVLANDVLQGNVERAWNTSQRFAVNSTVGIAGFVDVAGTWGRPHHSADLGQSWGVGETALAPAVQIPSNLRDSVGLVATGVAGGVALQGTAGTVVSNIGLGATVVQTIDSRAKVLPSTDAL